VRIVLKRFGSVAPTLVILAATSLAGCSWFGIGGPEQRLLIVLDHRSECFGPFPRACLLSPASIEGQGELLYNHIEGFTYEWGYIYDIIAEEYALSDPPQDASSRRLVLKRVTGKVRVAEGTEFDLVLSGEGTAPVLATSGVYTFLGDGTFSCAIAAECEALVAAVEQHKPVSVRFAHPASAQDPLRVVRWAELRPSGT
jgi:hypothetical protein